MRFVLLFLMILSLDLYLGSTIYWNYPQYHSQFLQEGQLVETFSVALALGAAGVALFCWRRSSVRGGRSRSSWRSGRCCSPWRRAPMA